MARQLSSSGLHHKLGWNKPAEQKEYKLNRKCEKEFCTGEPITPLSLTSLNSFLLSKARPQKCISFWPQCMTNGYSPWNPKSRAVNPDKKREKAHTRKLHRPAAMSQHDGPTTFDATASPPTPNPNTHTVNSTSPAGKQVSRVILRTALQKAKLAVECDTANDVEGAVAFYTEAVSLLDRVISTVDKPSDRKRLQEIVSLNQRVWIPPIYMYLFKLHIARLIFRTDKIDKHHQIGRAWSVRCLRHCSTLQ